MVTKEEAKKLYEGKFFYIVHDGNWSGESCKMLFGPYDNILYAIDSGLRVDKVSPTMFVESDKHKYAQVIDGKVVQMFENNEILVLDRKL